MKSSNLIIHNNSESFMEGNFINTSLLTEKGTIELQCNHGVYSREGSYISTVINTSPFESLIISWNVITPKNTKIRVWGRVFVDDTWSSWLSLGTWATNSDRFSSCENTSDKLASVSTDTLKIKGDGNTASALQYKIEFFSEDGETTPSLSLVAATIKNTLAGQNIPLAYKDNVRKEVIDNYEGVLPVYPYSQMTKDPKIAHVMCSATSTSMVLRFHGVDITPEEVAFGLYDSHYKGFGNWIFNTAYISSFGLESYVAYFHSIEDLKRELIKGNPVIVSVRYKQPDCDKSLPVITNAACSFTFGHIIVVKGFVIEEGKEYVVVNDPAAKTDVGVSLRYALEEFLAAWGGRVAYVIHKNKAITPAPERIKVQFKPTGQKKENNSISYEEYKLFAEGEEITLKKQGPCSIMFKPQKKERYSYYLNIEEVLDDSLMVEEESTSLWISHENILGISNLENQQAYDFRIVCQNAVTYDGVLTIS
ncbi:C39 family peptidase [Clostridium tunisiense]|uniref:C39 family peptidase n=1 Tax=Clostridium tunisiense TaxID=219748 RepID=UPI0002D2A8E5|nr:C39 family peptidase [Clostridium tunisiense]